MNGTFWLGVYPGLTTEMLDHVIRTVREFVASAPLGEQAERNAVAGVVELLLAREARMTG